MYVAIFACQLKAQELAKRGILNLDSSLLPMVHTVSTVHSGPFPMSIDAMTRPQGS